MTKSASEYIEAPSLAMQKRKYSIFLAGGITDCPDWQRQMAKLLSPLPVTIYNPRRKNFPIENPAAAKEQIRWEFKRLREVDIVVFWFSRGSLNPIVLYELGAALERRQPVVIGCDQKYERKQDVEIQVALMRPEARIETNIKALASAAKQELTSIRKLAAVANRRRVVLQELPARLAQFTNDEDRLVGFKQDLLTFVRGSQFDVALKYRMRGDPHICFDIFSEDDNCIHQTACNASTAWLEDLISVLNKAKGWLMKNARVCSNAYEMGSYKPSNRKGANKRNDNGYL